MNGGAWNHFARITPIGGFAMPPSSGSAYSTVMVLWVGPVIAWAVHGTPISFRDILTALSRPVASIFVASGVSFGVRLFG